MFKAASALSLGLMGAFASTSLVSAEEINAVALENGSVLRSYTSEYGSRASSSWIALALIDGNADIGWSSAKKQSAPNTFVFELAKEFSLSSFAFDNTKSEETRYPGISARTVSVLVSNQSQNGPFQEVAKGEIALAKETRVSLPQAVNARWVKLVITGNGGYAEYTELMEFSAFGKPVTERSLNQKYSGVYETNWGLFYLEYDRGELRGCYDHDNGYFTGKTVDGVMNIEWREARDDQGTAALAITEDGGQFSGLWYRNATLHGTWLGTYSSDQSNRPRCAAPLVQTQKSAISVSLDTYGSAKLYGIYFDFDSDVIKPESAETLNDIHTWLQNNPGKNVVFEGHTDSKGSDAYNQTLSAKRAVAVKGWLMGRGIAPSRLASVGLGEAQPVADNHTANGRSLNRRVEMKVTN